MEWDLETCAWNGASKLEIQDNSYNNHAGSNLLGINNMFSMDLKLGRLEDIREESLKNSMPFNMASLSSSSSVRVLEQSKRGRPRNQGTRQNSVSCLVDGCNFDLNMCREYHRRHKVCERHSKTPVVLVRGKEQRFCQQCSRFHSLEEFDEAKRSCRKRLDGHNRRRRKRQPQSFYMPESARGFLSSHTGDGMLQFCCPQMNNWNWATMSQPDNNQQTTYQPDESGCALSLLSRYPSQSSETCVGPPTMLAMTMNTDLNLNSNLVQLSYSQSLEFIDTSLSSSTNASNF